MEQNQFCELQWKKTVKASLLLPLYSQSSDVEIKALQERVELNEQRQQQMVAFLAQAMQHPALVQHLMASSQAVKRIDDGKREWWGGWLVGDGLRSG